MIRTALTDLFDLRHPIVLAPMGSVSGGHLAASVSNAGALGLVGGGYGDMEWLRTELSRVKGDASGAWGVGLITWSIKPQALDLVLSYRPQAVLLSFGDPRPAATPRRIGESASRSATTVPTPAVSRIRQTASAHTPSADK